MESRACCGMELIAKQSYGIKPQKNAPLVMPCAYGNSIHAKRDAMPSRGLDKKRQAQDLSFFGGGGEIRTLEPCYRLHDFQSCALDQLGDSSKYCA